MITKTPRHGKDGYFDLKVTDKNGKSFIMTVGGNHDLYWLPENYKEYHSFEIDQQDEISFIMFSQLFDAVKKKDDPYKPVLQNNTITFISEEWQEDESNILKIIKEDKSFTIDFIKNENQAAWSVPHRGCAICFCNSGSRVPRVETLFMRMFNFLAYECDLIETVDNQDENSL